MTIFNIFYRFDLKRLNLLFTFLETPRVQENPPGLNLPDLEHHPSQLRPMVGHLAHLLLRVRGPAVGHRQAGRQVHRVRGQVPRKMQGPAQRRLPST